MILLDISAILASAPQFLDLVLVVLYLFIRILQLLLCDLGFEFRQSIPILGFGIGFVEHSLYLLDLSH